MDNSNNITLINQLCETFLTSENIPVTSGAVKKLKTLFISYLFKSTHSGSEIDILESTDPSSLLKTDILCHATKSRNSDNVVVDKMYDTIEEMIKENDTDNQRNIFAFLHELSKLNEIKQTPPKSNKCTIPVSKSNRLFSEIIRYEDLDWSLFHKDPSSISTTCFDYPFFEKPGDGISFFEEHINDIKLPRYSSGLCDMSYKVWRFDLNKQVDPVVQDEGFVTPGSEFSGGNSINDESSSQCSDKSELDFSKHIINTSARSWDRLGNNDTLRELPFSSESIDSIVHFWKIANSSQRTGMKCVPIGVQITFEEFITDIEYLLFGIASHSFYFNQDTKLFQIRDRLHTATLSPEILAGVCEDLLKCANCFHSLKIFAEERLQLAYGSIHFTFCKCIQQILNMYRYSLLRIEWQKIKYLSNLRTLILPLQRKLTFLAKFCLISINERATSLKFPSGAQLLDYLYSHLSKVFETDLNYMLFYMFESCCNSYLRIVTEWIFDGCFSNADNYSEFFIEIRREYEICRDWRRVSCIGIREKKVPQFLAKFYKEIFVCGKSINLLKICSSIETMDNLFGKCHPNLACCFNEKQLIDYEQKWLKYRSNFEEHFVNRINIKDRLLRKYEVVDEQIKKIQQNRFRKLEETSSSTEIIDCEIIQNDIGDLKENSPNEPGSTETESELPPTSVQDASTCSEAKAQITIGFTPMETSENKSQDQNESLSSTSKEDPVSLGSGDCVENTPKRVKDLISLIEQKTSPNEKTLRSKNFGGGDCPSTPSSNTVLKEIGNVSVPSALMKNKLKSMSSLINSPLEDTPKSKLTTPLSACQENKLKIMSSEYHIRLNESLNSSHEMPKPKPTVMTACQENKLKIMSSEYHNRLNDSINSSQTEPPKQIKPLSAAQENKLKVMSSEYHNRLSITKPEIPAKPIIKMTACQENKLKVMTSEYHVRLNESIDQATKTEPEKCAVLSAAQENKLKIMSSEYHQRLSFGVTEQTPKREKSSISEQNKHKVMSSEYHIRLQNTERETDKNQLKQDDQTNASRVLTQRALNKQNNQPGDRVDLKTTFSEENLCDNLSKISEEKDTNVDTALEQDTQKIQHTNIFSQKLENFQWQCIDSVNIDSISDVDFTSLEHYLAQSISIPLRIQMKLVNEATLRVFIEEEYYLDHLTSLRDYLLLRKPEFTVSLTNSVFKLMEKAKNPYLLLNGYTLSSILQRALLATGAKETITFGKKLSLTVDDDIPENFTLTNIKELNCLTLNYSIKWPINILITEPIMKKYCKIFKFLLQIQRVMWVLKRDFITLKNLKLGKSIQYMKIQLYRHNMTQVMKILQEYIMREALETCWNNFVDNLSNAEIDLDVLYMSHLKYINKTVQRCFLCDLSSPCRESILDMFSMILKYHEALKAGVWKRNVEVNFLYHTNFNVIDEVYDEFIKCLNLVRSNLKVLVYGKQKTYYECLYLELSKNAEDE